MNKRNLVLIFALLGLAACQPEDPPLTSPAPAFKPPPPPPKIERPTSEVAVNGLQIAVIDSRVDILFVIDDSASMKEHVSNLSRNINKFVDAFAQVESIDWHLAFTHVHDRKRYGPIVPPICGDNTTWPDGTSAAGRVNWEDPGTIKPFIGGPSDRRYLTKNDDFRTILRNTWDPARNGKLLKDLLGPTKKNPNICAYGPEDEESFTPVLGAVEVPTVMNGANVGFRRDGAFFVAIIISDAKDESGIQAADFVRRLKAATKEAQLGKKRTRVFSVAISPGTKIGDGKTAGYCRPDPVFFTEGATVDKEGNTHYNWHNRVVADGENPLVDAARLTEDSTGPKDGQVLSICAGDYGAALADFGFQVQKDTLSDLSIELNYRPQIFLKPDANDPDYAAKLQEYEAKRLQVYIGNTKLKEGTEWNYNSENTTVIVYGNRIDWNKFKGQKVRVSYTPADSTKRTTKPL